MNDIRLLVWAIIATLSTIGIVALIVDMAKSLDVPIDVAIGWFILGVLIGVLLTSVIYILGEKK